MAAKTPTLSEFKKLSKDIAPAAKAVLMARVFAEMERERVNAYIQPLFESYRFNDLPKIHDYQEPIADVEHLYLCDDETQVAAFFADCDKAHREHGFIGPAGHCPALTAENLVMTTERLLIELSAPLFGIDAASLWGENRKKYLDLIIGAAIKSEGEAA